MPIDRGHLVRHSRPGDLVELTAVGDAMNTTARLATTARAGEVLVTTAAAQAAGLDPSLERRSLELKAKQ
jgi:adenylate cyclase